MHSTRFRCAAFCAALAFAAGSTSADPTKSTDGTQTKALTAESLVAWVLEANPALAAIQAAAESAAFRIETAGSLDDPMLSYGVAPLTVDGGRGLNQRIDLSQRIPWPGTLAARESAARFDAIAADRDVDGMRLRIISQAKTAHAEWRFVHAALDIHHATQALLEDLIATAETRYAAGRASKQDVLQAEVENGDLDNQLLRLLRIKTTVQARINALLNRPPDAPLPPASPIALTGALPSLERLLELVLVQHPDLARLEARTAASASRVTLASRAFYPDLQLGVGYNSLWDDADKRPIFGVSMNIPLDRSKRRADLGRAKADKRHAKWSLVERRAGLLADVARARAEVVEAQASVVLYQNKLVPLAEEYLETAVVDYQSGSGSFLNVITAEQRKLRTDLALARARADYARRLADLERSLGAPIRTAETTAIDGEDP